MGITDRLLAHAAKRPMVDVRMCDFLACEDSALIKIRALSADEDLEATKRAVEFRRGLLSTLPEKFSAALAEDPQILGDANSIETLFIACRDAENQAKTAFPTSAFMRENMTHEELSTLYGFYEKAVIKASKNPRPITEDELDVIQSGAAASASTDAPDRVLMALSKPMLADVAVRLAVRATEAAERK